MSIVVNGSGTITGISTGGLPDGSVDVDTLAANSVTAAKIVDGTIVDAEVTSLAATKLTGTIADARFPATLPAISGAALTSLPNDITHNFVASGAIANGKPVILKTDGEVEVVAESNSNSSVNESIPAGSSAVVATYNSGSQGNTDSDFDPNTPNKFVIIYSDDGNGYKGTAAVGTVSGTSISWGTSVVFRSASTGQSAIKFDPNNANKFVIAYDDNTNNSRGMAIVGTVSGTTISFGSPVAFIAAGDNGIREVALSFDPNTANKFVIIYKDGNTGDYGNAVVGTLSGTTPSFGSPAVFNSAGTIMLDVEYDLNTANKCMIVYRDYGNSHRGTAIIGTVSGTAISFGSEVAYTTGEANYNSIAPDPNNANKYVISYSDNGNSNYSTSLVATVSGTTPSFGTPVVSVARNTTWYQDNAFDPNTANKFVVVNQGNTGSNFNGGVVVVGTVSGTSISFGSENAWGSTNSQLTSVHFDSAPANAGKFVITYMDNANSNRATGIVGQIAATAVTTTTNLTTTNFIGTSTAAYADDATATILLKGGVSTNQSSLTIGSDYYIQGDGTLATSADTVSVKLGKAISATTVLLAGE